MRGFHLDPDTPATRLIAKAAFLAAPRADATPQQKWHAARDLELLGAVAADVLGMCHTAFAFIMAIRDSLRDHPLPHLAASRTAADERSAWANKITAEVLARL